MPSFLSAMDWPGRIAVLVAAEAVTLLASFAVTSAGAATAWVCRAKLIERIIRIVLLLVVAVVAGTLALLMFDNFTLTLFHFGIRRSPPAARVLYLFGVALITWLFFRRFQRWTSAPAMKAEIAAVFLFAVVAIAAIARPYSAATDVAIASQTSHPYNVIILGADGVNAERTSVYGSARDTTPFLRSLARESLVADNAFPNSGNTGGSTTALLTGRSPIDTGVIYPPEILRGRGSFRHLPGILKGRGYATLQATVRHYADAYDLNFRHAFDETNGRRKSDRFTQFLIDTAGNDGAYLLEHSWQRVKERALHIAAVESMRDVHAELTGESGAGANDSASVTRLVELIRNSREPFFAHVHLLGTHGARFAPRQRRFSAGKEQNEDWMPDFLDDALLDFDSEVRYVVSELRNSRKLDRTILVIYSDHGAGYHALTRVPLIIRFPHGQHRGRIGANVQNTDVAPTILQALNVAQPSWMTGSSLLRPIDPCRILMTFSASGARVGAGSDPLYSLGEVGVVRCNDGFTLEVNHGDGIAADVRRSWQSPDSNCGCEKLTLREAVAEVMTALEKRGRDSRLALLEKKELDRRALRAELAPLFVRAIHGADFKVKPQEKSRFLDVPSGSPLSGWVDQLVADGITLGCSETHFCPELPITRAQLAVMYGRALHVKPAAVESPFKDLEEYGTMRSGIARAVADGAILPCAPDRFCPTEPATLRDLERAAKLLSAARSGH